MFFLFLPFSLERKRKKQGEPTNGSPLPPFQRPTGAPPLSVDPAQWEGLNVFHQTEEGTAPRERKAKEGEKRRDYPGQGNSRMQKLWPAKGAATSRPPPRYGRDGCGRGFRFSASGSAGMGCRRCRERLSFLVTMKWKKHRAGGKRKKAKNGGNYPGQGNSRMQKLWPEKEAATSRPPPRYCRGELCGADFSFLVKFWYWERV